MNNINFFKENDYIRFTLKAIRPIFLIAKRLKQNLINQGERNMLNLEKGQSLDLTKDRPNLTKIMIGAGWDVVESGPSLDADLSAFLLTNGGIKDINKDVVFFGNLNAEGIAHSGDNLTGEGEGDDEQITVDLAALPSGVTSVLFVLNIFKAKEKNQNLSMISSAVIRAVDESTNEEIARFESKEGSTEDALILCEVNRDGEFKAVGEAKSGTLNEIAAIYQ